MSDFRIAIVAPTPAITIGRRIACDLQYGDSVGHAIVRTGYVGNRAPLKVATDTRGMFLVGDHYADPQFRNRLTGRRRFAV